VALARRPPASGTQAVFFGDPDAGDSESELPASAREVALVYETLRAGPEPFIGEAATKAELLARAPQARLLHVAAHHVFNPNLPLLSFLKMAGGHGSDFAYALEVMDLDLSAQLVTLSACRTAGSRIETGDEQYGMVRAFLAAGSRSVMSTLW